MQSIQNNFKCTCWFYSHSDSSVGTLHESGADDSTDSRSIAEGTINFRDMARQDFQRRWVWFCSCQNFQLSCWTENVK